MHTHIESTTPRSPFKAVKAAESAVHPVDLHVGAKLRARRKFLGLSQQAVAEATGVTFQQLQKRERGNNRLSASALYMTAKALGVSTSYFFEDMPETSDGEVSQSEQDVHAFMMTTEGLELAQVFPRLPAHVRRATLAYLNKLAGDENHG